MAQVLDTASVPDRERGDYWRDLICDTYVELDCAGMPREGFWGSVRAQAVADVEFSLVASLGHDVIRSPKQIAKSTREYFLVSLQTIGTGLIEQDGKQAHLDPGDFAIYDSTRPYRLRFGGEVQQAVLKLPRERLLRHLPAADCAAAVRVRGTTGLGRMVSNLIHDAAEHLVDAGELLPGAVAENVVSLLAVALGNAIPNERAAQGCVRLSVFRHACNYIHEHLGDPGLSVDRVAAAHRVTGRYLRQLFAEHGLTASRYIWDTRLDCCRRDLENPLLDGLTITQISFKWGFSDSAHFSRSFRKRFGMAPRDCRTRH